MYKFSILISFLGLKLSCDHLTQPPATHTPIARVDQHYLYKEDLVQLVPVGSSPQDSTELVNRYIQTWVINYLLANKAGRDLDTTKIKEIEEKVSKLRDDLLVYEYVKKLVDEQLNKEITEQEIQTYYEANQENFKLKSSIVKGKFVVIPKRPSSKTDVDLKKLLISQQDQDILVLKEYCSQFAIYHSLDGHNWLKWEDIITKTAFRHIPASAKVFKKTSFTEIQDDKYRYYLKIDAYKMANDIAPIELVRDQIAKELLYKRKIELEDQIKKNCLQQAKPGNDYEIYEGNNK